MPQVVLIGPPGSGKSTIGKALAKHLGVKFLDTDKYVERNYGKKISDIFVEEGEEKFRELEYEALQESLIESDYIVALGGGAPIAERAQLLIKECNARIVFLDISLSVAAPRVGFNRDRPLLLGNPRAQWQALYELRRPIYESLATSIVLVDSKTTEQVVNEIVKGGDDEKN
ncbi:unannotated protein [freshwater metagenome]|uniref:Unannotated protein n=1 Tax=freshwater metagenome TaxID=449393 RepID=A0A6J7IV54_9ZZZZ|nr:AAA family ATPase [Actinomycetota bacterium]